MDEDNKTGQTLKTAHGAEVRLFLNHGTFKYWEPGLSYPDPWDRAYNVTGDGELAILNTIRAQDFMLTKEERKTTEALLRKFGFTAVAWDRMRNGKKHRAGPFGI